MWMNEYDINDAASRIANERVARPNLAQAVGILDRLREWTNSNSDGWPYWQAPSRAAAKLMTLVHYAVGYGPTSDDITGADLKAALTPIKAFLTRQQNAKRMTAADRLWILEGDIDD